MVKVSFSSYFRSINEFHQGPYRYITSLLYHKVANRQMLWSRNLLMLYLLARFNWHQEPQQEYRSGASNNILDVFEIDTKPNFLEAFCGKRKISKKWRRRLLASYLRRGPWKCWTKCIILQSFHSELSQTSKMEFFFLTWKKVNRLIVTMEYQALLVVEPFQHWLFDISIYKISCSNA